jgi:hypothetical protein
VAWLAAHPTRRSNSEAMAQRREFNEALRKRIRDFAASRDLSDEGIRPVLSSSSRKSPGLTHGVNINGCSENRGSPVASSQSRFSGFDRPPTVSTLHRRAQFAPEPTRNFSGIHRIEGLDHALINAIASRALECSDIKARYAWGGPCQRGHCFAPRTWRPVRRTHDASPWIRRERYRTLSHRMP